MTLAYFFFFKTISVWQSRRVVLTKDCISFAFINHFQEIDRIPLSGIDYLKTTDNMETEGQEEQDPSQVHFSLLVATNVEGHNSGRSYYLRTSSKKTYDEFIVLLTKYTKTARDRAQASTFFQRVQLAVRKFYTGLICQSFFALIIIGVSSAQKLILTLLLPNFIFLLQSSYDLILMHTELHLHNS